MNSTINGYYLYVQLLINKASHGDSELSEGAVDEVYKN